jgi:short-subunit dehydrogenase
MLKNLSEKILFPPKKINQKRLEKAIRGKTILITGATYGIGEATAYLLAMAEVHLVLVARSEEKLMFLKNELEKKACLVSIFKADLYEETQVNALNSFLQTEIKKIDVVIHNAGKSIRRSIWDSLERYHDFTRTIRLNYLTPVSITIALLPMLAESKGHLINISALSILMPPTPYWAAYHASKTAFDQWLQCVAPELKQKNITVSTLYLPLVRTRMISPTKAYENAPAMQPKDVAAVIAKTICKKNKKFFIPWWAYPLTIVGIWRNCLWAWITTQYLKKQ